MQKIVLVHGYQGSPDENWFPWLRKQLEAKGVAVVAPALPNPNAPQLAEWLPALQQAVGGVDEQTYFVGHSLGCATILRYIESLPAGTTVGGAVLVAGFAEPIVFSELDSFTVGAWDDEHIKRAAGKIVAINSDDDPYVPLVMGERLSQRFGAKLVTMHGAGHISESFGFVELPVAMQELSTILEP